MYILILVGTSGPAGIKAGIGATLPVSGSAFSLPETKPEAGSRNSEFLPFVPKTLLIIGESRLSTDDKKKMSYYYYK